MKKSTTNIPASVLARLKYLAEKDSLDFNFVLIRYTQERFLAKLAASGYVNKFVLKGGFLLLAYSVEKARPTKDIDFLGVNIGRDSVTLVEAIKEILSFELNDGVVFLQKEIKAEVIKEDADYEGIRIRVPARIGKARTTLQIDFGFGDVVTPGPLQMDYPTLLKTDDIKILAYSKETIISEKLESIAKLTMFNTRLKDFYDIYFLSGHFSFEGRVLQAAIKETFKRRQTSLESAIELIDSDFGNRTDFARLWSAFKRRTGTELKEGFPEVFSRIRGFLMAPIRAELDSGILQKTWNPPKRAWEKAQ